MKKVILLLLIFTFIISPNIFCKENILSKKVIYTKNAPKPIGPYSQGIQAGNTLYLSGQIAIVPETGKMIEGDIKKETEQVLNNIKAVLKEAKYDMNDIVKTTIYITDMKDFADVNSVYATFFKDNFPVRETVQVAGLPKNARVEISVVAVK